MQKTIIITLLTAILGVLGTIAGIQVHNFNKQKEAEARSKELTEKSKEELRRIGKVKTW